MSEKSITINIKSLGGSVGDGLAIYKAVKEAESLGYKVIVNIDSSHSTMAKMEFNPKDYLSYFFK